MFSRHIGKQPQEVAVFDQLRCFGPTVISAPLIAVKLRCRREVGLNTLIRSQIVRGTVQVVARRCQVVDTLVEYNAWIDLPNVAQLTIVKRDFLLQLASESSLLAQ